MPDEHALTEAPRWTGSSCRSCGQRIVWAVTQLGARIPVDLEPDPDGNVILVALSSGGLGTIIRAPHTAGDGAALRFVSHFATCPHAETHRKRKGSARADD